MADSSAAKPKKDILTAVLLNLIIPGAGYMYAGRVVLGVLVLILALMCAAAYFMSFGLFSGGWLFFAVVGAIDGYLTVSKYNRGIDSAVAASMRKCPHCAEKIQPDAKVCRFCQRDVA